MSDTHTRKKWTSEMLDKHYRSQYGISLAQARQFRREHNNQCDVCARKNCRLCIDHDHKTGKIRGLLCVGCNRAIGFARDDARILRGLAEYIGKANRRFVF